jgi:hypothetical protein
METRLPALEFFGVVSMLDFTVDTGEGDDDFEINPHIHSALDILGITADLRKLYQLYFETPDGQGDVHAFYGPESTRNVFAIDLYRDPTDQLDIISFGVRCDRNLEMIVKPRLRSFFDSAAIQLGFEEANISTRLRALLGESQYAVLVEAGKFARQQILHSYQPKNPGSGH